MKAAFKAYISGEDQGLDYWFWIKLVFVLSWFVSIWTVFLFPGTNTYPNGFCTLFPCDLFQSSTIRILLFVWTLLASTGYVMEKYMLPSLASLSLISVIAFSLLSSKGIGYSNNFSSGIFIAQFLAYVVHFFTPNKAYLRHTRIQFPVQIIAASYVLSALSKLSTSDIYWFFNHEGFALQVKKSLLMTYINTGQEQTLLKADLLFNFLMNYPIITHTALFFALALEFFTFIVLLKPNFKVVYGWLLIALHLGIYLFMDIHYLPMHLLLFFVGAPLLIKIFGQKVKSIFKS